MLKTWSQTCMCVHNKGWTCLQTCLVDLSSHVRNLTDLCTRSIIILCKIAESTCSTGSKVESFLYIISKTCRRPGFLSKTCHASARSISTQSRQDLAVLAGFYSKSSELVADSCKLFSKACSKLRFSTMF